jgi:hypothetical protein
VVSANLVWQLRFNSGPFGVVGGPTGGAPDAGVFQYGGRGTTPVAGRFLLQAAIIPLSPLPALVAAPTIGM